MTAPASGIGPVADGRPNGSAIPDRGAGHAQFYMKESQVPVDLSHFRACFCDVTGQHNVRTVLAALIPPHCVCGNKVPVCRFDREDIRLPLLWSP